MLIHASSRAIHSNYWQCYLGSVVTRSDAVLGFRLYDFRMAFSFKGFGRTFYEL